MRSVIRIALLTSFIALSAFRLFAGSIDVVFYDDRFGAINDSTGTYTQISVLPITAAGGIASMNGLLYLEDLGNNLLTVDPVTGASQLVGSTGLNSSVGAFAGGNSTGGVTGLFEVDYASNLYAIDPSTGKATLVGATGLAANNGAFDTSLSSDGASLLYTAGRAGQNDELYSLNVTTGVATDLGSTGVTGIAGSAFVNGQLELYQYGQANNYIYSAPDDSANFTRGAQLDAQIVDGGAVFETGVNGALQVDSVAPEPGPMLLMGAGLIVMGLIRRHGLIRRLGLIRGLR